MCRDDRLGESLFDALPDPVVGYAREDGTFWARTANAAFHDVFAPTEPIAGRELRSVLVTDAESFVDALDHRAPRTVVTHPANSDREFLLRAVPTTLKRESSGGYAVYTDVTEQREQIQELEAELDRVDQLVSVVTHDLRNPLEIAQIRLELARETGETEHLEKVESAHDRIADLVDELRETTWDWDDIDAAECLDVGEAVQTAWEGVATGEAMLETVGDIGDVRADPEGLRRLLENLFRNAVEHGSPSPPSSSEKAVEHGSTGSRPSADEPVDHREPSVRVEVGPLGNDPGFYVADDGPGISSENRTEVFEAGFSTRSEGDGLGLAIVEGIADAHDWGVEVTESDSGGARFEIHVREDGEG